MKLTVDGKEIQASEGMSVLEAALAADIFIPHLCSHPDLEPKGGCRLCSVEIEGTEGAVPSCKTAAADGMIVRTKGPEAEKVRRTAMELILASHPSDCTGCPKYGKCELQSMYQYMGVGPEAWRKKSRTVPTDDKNPLITHLFTRCIRCGRCIRACQEKRGVKVLDYVKTANGIHAGVPEGKTLAEAGCRFCGACIEVCPTGSIVDAVGIMDRYPAYSDNVVPCRAECPAHIDIPAYIRAVKEGRPGDAVGIIREKVPFPLVLGYICNHLCESVCKRGSINDPMGIRNLKRYAVEHDEEQTWKGRGFMKPRTGKRVAIVGSGPCGLTAAYYLNKLGHDVTVFEKKPQLGGPMTSGIPAYRLPLEKVQKEIDYILETGVKAETDHEIRDAATLKQDYDAVLVAVGVSHGKRLPIPGNDLPGVYTAIDLLARCRRGETLEELGEKVCVIGSGSVGYDIARSLLRLGKQVTIACLEKADALMADEDDQAEGAEEGIELLPSRAFEAVESDESGHVTGLRMHTVLSSTYDKATGKVTEIAEENSRTTVPCDSVVFATGQHTGLLDYENFGIDVNFRGYPEVNGFQTSLDGVFAAGDAITGISFVIRAIAQARAVVPEIDRYLGGAGVIDETLTERTADPEIGRIEGFAGLPRTEQELISAQTRVKNNDNVYVTYSCGEASGEAQRCLQCDLRLQFQRVRLWNDYGGAEA